MTISSASSRCQTHFPASGNQRSLNLTPALRFVMERVFTRLPNHVCNDKPANASIRITDLQATDAVRFSPAWLSPTVAGSKIVGLFEALKNSREQSAIIQKPTMHIYVIFTQRVLILCDSVYQVLTVIFAQWGTNTHRRISSTHVHES